MHPRLCQVDGSELYLCKDLIESVRREGRRGEGERRKSNYFFPPISRRSPSCVRQIRAEKLGRAVLRRSAAWEAESWTFWSCSVSTPELSLIHPRPLSRRRYWVLFLQASLFHHTKYETRPHQNVRLRGSSPRGNGCLLLKYLIKTSHGALRRGAEQLLFLKHPITLVPPAVSWRWGLAALKGLI